MTTNGEEKNEDQEITNNIHDELNEETTNEDSQASIQESENKEITLLKELLARNQADYMNFKMRVERDREDMIYFLKVDIFKKILPKIDDMRRIIKNTPPEQTSSSLYEGIILLEKNMIKDLESLGIKEFDSIGQEVDPAKHEVMTQIPSDNPGIIVDEFEKGYMIGDRVLRVAKVIVGS